MLRVVVDAMVWIAAVTGRHREGDNRAVLDAWMRDEFLVLTSTPLLNEMERVLLKDFKRPPEMVEDFITLFLARAQPVLVRHQVMGCKDLNDNPVLETAFTGKASYIVTKDKRLRYLEPFVAAYYMQRGIAIKTPNEFLAETFQDRMT